MFSACLTLGLHVVPCARARARGSPPDARGDHGRPGGNGDEPPTKRARGDGDCGAGGPEGKPAPALDPTKRADELVLGLAGGGFTGQDASRVEFPAGQRQPPAACFMDTLLDQVKNLRQHGFTPQQLAKMASVVGSSERVAALHAHLVALKGTGLSGDALVGLVCAPGKLRVASGGGWRTPRQASLLLGRVSRQRALLRRPFNTHAHTRTHTHTTTTCRASGAL